MYDIIFAHDFLCGFGHPFKARVECCIYAQQNRGPCTQYGLDGKVHIPSFSPRKLDLLKTWVGGGLNESRRAGTAGLFRLCGRLLGRRVPAVEPCQYVMTNELVRVTKQIRPILSYLHDFSCSPVSPSSPPPPSGAPPSPSARNGRRERRPRRRRSARSDS